MSRLTHNLNKKIQGNGTSLWCSKEETKRTFIINKVVVHKYDNDDDPDLQHLGHANVYGKQTRWYHYTDNQIEKEVKEVLKKIDKRIKNVYWSEQGMQPGYGWNFGIEFYKSEKPSTSKSKKLKKYKSGTLVKTTLIPEYTTVLRSGRKLNTMKELEDEMEGFEHNKKEMTVPNIIYNTDTYYTLTGAKARLDMDLYSQGVVLHTQIKKTIK